MIELVKAQDVQVGDFLIPEEYDPTLQLSDYTEDYMAVVLSVREVGHKFLEIHTDVEMIGVPVSYDIMRVVK